MAVEAFDTGLVLPLSVSGPLLCGKPVVGKSVFRGTVGLGAIVNENPAKIGDVFKFSKNYY